MYVPLGNYGILSIGKVAGDFDEVDVQFAEILGENATTALKQVDQTRRLREQRERLIDQNERLDEFASVVAHDLRNPINVAQGSFERYCETGDPNAADDVRYAFDRMDEIVEDVLVLAREGWTTTDVETVDLAQIARRAWANVDGDDVSLDVRTDRVVRADGQRLQRLLENLFRNSVQHGSANEETKSDGDGDGLTTVTVGAADSGFYVADDGVGIPDDVRDAVFESGTTTADDGTGLGLAIVEQIADAHGFDVTATESADGGARFDVSGVPAPDTE